MKDKTRFQVKRKTLFKKHDTLNSNVKRRIFGKLLSMGLQSSWDAIQMEILNHYQDLYKKMERKMKNTSDIQVLRKSRKTKRGAEQVISAITQDGEKTTKFISESIQLIRSYGYRQYKDNKKV